jgi:spore coat polysaccharide biosynthesis protein SpsF
MRVLGVVQARMGSSRLPGKVMRQLAGRSVLGRVVRSARTSGVLDDLVVATTTEAADDAVVAECARLGVAVHRGPVEDVLTRFLGAVAVHPADAVVRFTADCPLLDPAIVSVAVRTFAAMSTLDYLSTALARTLPRGLDVEVVSAAALHRLDRLCGGYHRSHVTSYLWSNPALFDVLGLDFAPDRSQLRLTLDTEADWSLISAVVAQFGDTMPALAEMAGWLLGNPQIAALNAGVAQKPLEVG